MDRGNILSGAAFSAVLMSALAFLGVLLAVGVLAHTYVAQSARDQLREEVGEQWDLLASEYHEGDADALSALIASATLRDQRAIGLFDATGTPIAGNIAVLPAVAGWQEGRLAVAGRARNHVSLSAPLGPLTLVVAEPSESVRRTERALFRALAISGFVVVLTMLASGYVFSRKSLRKLERLEETLARVSDGDMGARMALSVENDQIDRIAARMNAHLDILSRLMGTTRTTAAAVAHDLKSPLARAYLGLGRAQSKIEAGGDPRADIEDTQAELTAMNGIFDTILRLARIEAGGDGTRFAPVDFGALLEDLAETYRVVAEENGQSFAFAQVPGADFTVNGDVTMLRQMVVNLLQNAVTHAGAGVAITMELARVDGHLRLRVADTGPGIPEAARDAVFQPFHRLDPSRHRPGSGLGLALVRAIAERHGATIALSDNAPGLRVDVRFG